MQHLLELAALVVPAWPGLWALSSPSFRKVFPFDAVRIGLACVLYLAGVAAVAILEPRWLWAPAIPAAAVGVWLLWRARPGYGISSGLPPGSLWPLPVRPWSDPDFYRRQEKRFGNVFKLCQFGQPMVCIVGIERANRLLVEHDARLVAPPLPFSRFIEGGYLRYLPEESHADYRRLFQSLFDAAVVARAEPRLAAALRGGCIAMAEASAATGSAPVAPSVMRAMFAAWAGLFYGIDEHHEDFARLKALSRVIDIRKARWASRRRVEPALAEIEAMLRRRMEALAADAAAPACFLGTLVRSFPRAIEDRTVVGNLVYIMEVSWGDVSGLLVWIFKMLTEHPAWRDRLRSEIAAPDAGARERADDLATRIVQETLRLEQSEHRYRRATAEVDLDGFRIPKGWLIRMCIREGHQDDATFAEPGEFDPDRFRGRTFARAEYAPFGAGRLACIGEHLAKTTGRIFATELVAGFDWEVVDDGPAEIGTWLHNAPSARLRVRMTPRSMPR